MLSQGNYDMRVVGIEPTTAVSLVRGADNYTTLQLWTSQFDHEHLVILYGVRKDANVDFKPGNRVYFSLALESHSFHQKVLN